MTVFNDINMITIIMIGIFLMPIVVGALNPISGSRIYHSLLSMVNNFKFILGVLLTFHSFRMIFFNEECRFFEKLYQLNPSLKNWMFRYEHDIVAYVIVFFILLYMILWILDLCAIPFYRYIMYPLKNKISVFVQPMSEKAKRVWSIAWGIPKSICMIVVFSLLLSFYINYVNNPTAVNYINRSIAYQQVSERILNPLFSIDLAKNIPVAVFDSIKKANEDFTSSNQDGSMDSNYWKQTVIKYFNGVTLDEAVKSNTEIDDMARKIVGTEENERQKAYLLYDWVRRNIQYDKEKAEMISENSSHINSGAIVTYVEKKGVCFDYACLYVTMCQAVDIKVRFVTGMGFNGVQWGEHAWNQVYDSKEESWIPVDTTFGSGGVNYFDNLDFSESHKYEVIQGEW